MEHITINDIMYMVVTVAIPMLLRLAYQFVMTKVSDTQYEKAAKAVMDAVVFVNQTFVDSLKESGNFDKIAQEQAFLKAKDAALDTMEKSTKKWIDKTYKDVDEWLTVQIESSVKMNKGGAQ